MNLKYPHDRIDGYVLLEVNGKYFVPKFTREQNERTPFLNIKRYTNAWRALLKRRFGKDFEPISPKNNHILY